MPLSGDHRWPLYEPRKQPLATMDLLIAATALDHRAAVVTANEQHFRRIQELDVRSYR